MKNNSHHASVLDLVAAILITGAGCDDKNFTSIWYGCWSGLIAQRPSPNPSPYRPGVGARLTLEPNLGQSDPRYKFLGRGDGYVLFLNEQETILDLGTRQIRLHLDGARPGVPAATGDAFHRTHYLPGPNPDRWIPNVPVYEEVGFTGVYPGIDIVYDARDGKLEHNFHLAPGADPARIRWALPGADRLAPDGDGLLIHAGDLRPPSPIKVPAASPSPTSWITAPSASPLANTTAPGPSSSTPSSATPPISDAGAGNWPAAPPSTPRATSISPAPASSTPPTSVAPAATGSPVSASTPPAPSPSPAPLPPLTSETTSVAPITSFP